MRSYLGRLLRFTSRSKPSNTSTKRSFHQKSTGPFARMSSASAAAALYAATISTASITGAVPENAKDKAHHLKDGKGFTNPWDSWIEIGGWAIARALLWRRVSGAGHFPDTTPPTVPVHKPTFLPTRETPALRATWLGHACYFVEFPSGFRCLFDPVFSERCSPFSWLGPKRYTEVPCQIEDIPIVDAVVISHNHYDHMDHPTILRIKAQHPNVHFFVPLGNKKWFLASGFTESQVTELDWWEERDITLTPSQPKSSSESSPSVSEPSSTPTPSPSTITARISCLPCQHTSARSLFDKAQTLWSSWSVQSTSSVWFGGDTGYRSIPHVFPKSTDDWGPGHDYPHCPAFAQIGKLRGPFDLGLIPIGAYDPRWIMSPMHANPYDSVEIFKDTKCKRAMGIHWGTWVLTEEDVLEPPVLLKKALAKSGISETGVFDVCEIGESREF